MRDRILAERLISSKKSILLLGPRQVGKSTLCLSLKPDLYINLASEKEYLEYSKDPSLIERRVKALENKKLICIDEIQRVPKLVNSVQVIIDTFKENHKFLLTGSSARKLKRGEVNLLPGRVILEHLDPLSILEIEEDFDLERALQVGMLPGIYLEQGEALDVLESYSESYLREEIRAEALTRNIGGFARFLDIAALLSGQWINYTKISCDCEVPKETVRRFFGLLEDTLIIFRLPSFKPRFKLSRRISQRDRFLFFDIGVRNSLLGLSRHSLTLDQRGSAFEQWITLQIIYLKRVLRKPWQISSFRSDSGAEVDLIIETEKELIALEIKSSKNLRSNDTRGLLSFEDSIRKYKTVRKIIAYTGEHKQAFREGVVAIPYKDLLMDLASNS